MTEQKRLGSRRELRRITEPSVCRRCPWRAAHRRLLITSAGWMAEPADKPTSLAGLPQHKLHDYDLRLLAVRRYGDTAVALVESTQKGSSNAGELWKHTFRYTDVWVRRHEGWLFAVRHARSSGRSRPPSPIRSIAPSARGTVRLARRFRSVAVASLRACLRSSATPSRGWSSDSALIANGNHAYRSRRRFH